MLRGHFLKFLIFSVSMSTGFATAQGLDQLPPLRALDFIGNLYGWFVGDGGTVLHTPDGGTTWKVFTVGRDDVYLLAVDFVNPRKGWVAGQLFTTNTNGIVMRTRDGGQTWETQHQEPFGDFRALSFADSLHGLAGGDGSGIFFTRDGGRNWQRGEPRFAAANIRSLQMIDSLRAWAEGEKIPLVRTFNGGKNWLNTDTTSIAGFLLFFVDSLHGWIHQEDNIIRRTINGGESWHSLQSPNLPISINYYELFFVNTRVGYISNLEGIFKSNDGGESWEQITERYRNAAKMFFLNENLGWAVGLDGVPSHKIAFTQDGGRTWIPPSMTAIQETPLFSSLPKNFIVHNNYPNPFNPETKIPFTIHNSDTQLKISIFTLHGEWVKTLWEGAISAGSHRVRWDGTDTQNQAVPSGMYLCRMVSKAETKIIKMLLLR